jgi:hypothetical protein
VSGGPPFGGSWSPRSPQGPWLPLGLHGRSWTSGVPGRLGARKVRFLALFRLGDFFLCREDRRLGDLRALTWWCPPWLPLGCMLAMWGLGPLRSSMAM